MHARAHKPRRPPLAAVRPVSAHPRSRRSTKSTAAAAQVCVLGYCIFPLNIASVICAITSGPILWRGLVVAVCFFWSTGASLGFMGELVPPNRKALAVYPLFLFYTSIGWLILIAAKR